MAECVKKDACKNYGKKCSQCWANSSIYDTHPFYTSEDLVQVVRCVNCIHFEAITLDSGISVGFGNCKNEKGINLYPKETDFCSYGTPKERGGEK